MDFLPGGLIGFTTAGACLVSLPRLLIAVLMIPDMLLAWSTVMALFAVANPVTDLYIT